MNIRKIISTLILTICMCFLCISGLADAGSEQVGTDEFFNKMISLGLLDKADAVDTVYMQRGDFLRLSMKIAGLGKLSADGEDMFSDISETSFNRRYINLAAKLGYIQGNGGKFYPQEPISYNEAVKIITEILGYGKIAISRGGYPTGYAVCAKESGLLDNVIISNAEHLTLQDGLTLIDAALESRVTETFFENNDVNVRFSNLTLAEYLDIGTIEGVISECAGTGIYSRSMRSDDMICIDGTYMRVDDISGFDGLLGMKCKAYYNNASKSGIKTLAYAMLSEENNVLTLNAEDITFENGSYSYYDENKEKTARLSDDFSLIYNGQFAVNDDSLMDTSNGFVKLVDNSGDKRYDVVFVYEFETFLLKDVNAVTESVITDSGKIIEAENDDDNCVRIYVDGKPESLDSVTAPAVVSYAESLKDNKKIKTLYISSEYISGTLDGVSDEFITVGGTDYKVANIEKENLLPKNEYKFYIDSFGYVFFYENVKNVYDYGYLWKFKANSTGLDSSAKMRIYNSSGVFLDYELADKITFNREKKLEKQSVPSVLEANGGCGQFIRFKLDSDGKICFVETASNLPVFTPDGEEGRINDVFRLSSSGQVKFRTGNYTFDMRVVVGTATKVFFIPTTGLEEDFRLVTRATLVNDTTYNYEAYNADKYGVAEFVACKINYRSGTHNYYIVDSVCKVLDSDGGERDGIRCSVNGTFNTFAVSESLDISSYNLKCGDVISIGTNAAGNAAYIGVLWRYTEDSYPDFMLNTIPYSQNLVGGKVTAFDRASGSLIVEICGKNYIFACTLANVTEYEDGAWETLPSGNLAAGDCVVIKNSGANVNSITVIR